MKAFDLAYQDDLIELAKINLADRAQGHLIFQRSAEVYLNLKSLFVLGTYLAGSLIRFHIRDRM
jgi:hypothetical protein